MHAIKALLPATHIYLLKINNLVSNVTIENIILNTSYKENLNTVAILLQSSVFL